MFNIKCNTMNRDKSYIIFINDFAVYNYPDLSRSRDSIFSRRRNRDLCEKNQKAKADYISFQFGDSSTSIFPGAIIIGLI